MAKSRLKKPNLSLAAGDVLRFALVYVVACAWLLWLNPPTWVARFYLSTFPFLVAAQLLALWLGGRYKRSGQAAKGRQWQLIPLVAVTLAVMLFFVLIWPGREQVSLWAFSLEIVLACLAAFYRPAFFTRAILVFLLIAALLVPSYLLYRQLGLIEQRLDQLGRLTTEANHRILDLDQRIKANHTATLRLENQMFVSRGVSDYMQTRVKPSRPGLPNVLLIINDALRGDCLGFNGYKKVRTPNLDRFAAGGVNFRNTISGGPWTSPGVTSVLTGVYPSAHGFWVSTPPQDRSLPPNLKTVVDVFRENGYFTCAFVGHNRRWFEASLKGCYFVNASEDHSGQESVNDLIEFVDSHRDLSPLFIVLHIYDPHSPYNPRQKIDPPQNVGEYLSARELERARKLTGWCGNPAKFLREYLDYIQEIQELDQVYGPLFDFLAGSSRPGFDLSRDIVAFTADHGEEFYFENGFYEHGRTEYIETTRVPLVFRAPGLKPGAIEDYVSNVRVMMTLIELAGLSPPRDDYARQPSLLGAIESRREKGGGLAMNEGIYMEEKVPIPGQHEQKTMVRPDGLKMVYHLGLDKIELYDLKTDPTEDVDLTKDPEKLKIAREMLDEMIKTSDFSLDYVEMPGKYKGSTCAGEKPRYYH